MMDEQRTRFEVLLEDVDRQLGALAESVAVVNTDMKDLKEAVSQLSTKVDRLEVFAMNTAPRLERIEGKVDKLEGKVDKLEGKVDKLEGKVGKLEEFASDAGPRLVRLEEFASDAGPRLVRLEEFASDARPRLVRLEEFASDARPRLVRIETHLALPVLPPRREKTKLTPSKHHRRKPTKRN